MLNIRSMRKMVREMNAGEILYVNAISCSKAMIDQLREYIETGVLAPVEEELEKLIVESARDKYRSGYSIAPQMTYVRR